MNHPVIDLFNSRLVVAPATGTVVQYQPAFGGKWLVTVTSAVIVFPGGSQPSAAIGVLVTPTCSVVLRLAGACSLNSVSGADAQVSFGRLEDDDEDAR